jgi:hypothetical protein
MGYKYTNIHKRISMKIAVFGDSYAADSHNQGNDQRPQDHTGWVEMIRQMNMNITIDNYAVCGSGNYFNWDQFNQLHASYDRVIFVVSHWDRHYIELDENFKRDPSLPPYHWLHAHSIQQVEHTLDSQPKWFNTDPAIPKLRALRDYWIHVGNDRERRQMSQLMLADIERQRPDCLLMSGFPPDMSLLTRPNQPNIVDAMALDVFYYFGDLFKQNMGEWNSHYTCHRHNHLNRHNNRLLANAVARWLATYDVNELANLPWTTDPERKWQDYFGANG